MAETQNQKVKPVHPTHEMTEWKNTIVTIIATPRFGQSRKCKKCDAEQAVTVCGQGCDNELLKPCCG